MIESNIKMQRGFTLVETFVAISILTLALVGPLSIAATSLTSSRYTRDQITAFYLAQEAEEFVHNVRDNNLAQIQKGNWDRNRWLEGLEACSSGGTCAIDVFEGEIYDSDYCGASVCPLKVSGGVYGYTSSWPDSIFTRTVRIDTLNTNMAFGVNEVGVVVAVSWQTGNLPVREVKLRQILMNR